VFEPTLLGMLVVLALLATVAWWQGGADLLRAGLFGGTQLLLRFGLLIVVAFLVAGLAEKLVPEAWVRSMLGEEAGVRGILIATAVGILTPSGPYVSLPLAAAMLRSGAGTAAVVAFVASWGLLALHRFIAWEVPMLGFGLAALRWAVCAALPIIAGLFVRLLLRSG